jgi:hypothetical protein
MMVPNEVYRAIGYALDLDYSSILATIKWEYIVCVQKQRSNDVTCKMTQQVSINVLPPYRIIGQLRILRQTLTFNFSQENIRYII